MTGVGCNPGPCQNGGACNVDNDGSFGRCDCTTGWTGTHCQTGKLQCLFDILSLNYRFYHGLSKWPPNKFSGSISMEI